MKFQRAWWASTNRSTDGMREDMANPLAGPGRARRGRRGQGVPRRDRRALAGHDSATARVLRSIPDSRRRCTVQVEGSNETCGRFVLNRTCCLIRSHYELGIEAKFWEEEVKA